jgi:SAM-dependent methyltransferase
VAAERGEACRGGGKGGRLSRLPCGARERGRAADARQAPRGPFLIRKLALLAAAGLGAAAWWWRRNPSACPYGQRFWVEAPHPFVTRSRLREALAPAPGERILEIGPGTGYYSLDVATRLEDGTLEIFDIQQKFLDHTVQAGRERGLSNINPTLGDAQRLPYEDESFDGAYLVTVLGEIPDQGAALSELARVLKPGGRLVVGELFGDPHWVSPHRLRERAEKVGLSFASRLGSPLGYFSRFQRIRP